MVLVAVRVGVIKCIITTYLVRGWLNVRRQPLKFRIGININDNTRNDISAEMNLPLGGTFKNFSYVLWGRLGKIMILVMFRGLFVLPPKLHYFITRKKCDSDKISSSK